VKLVSMLRLDVKGKIGKPIRFKTAMLNAKAELLARSWDLVACHLKLRELKIHDRRNTAK